MVPAGGERQQGTGLADQVKDFGLLPISCRQKSTFKEKGSVIRFCLGS